MALSANTNVAAAVANYFTDNFTALQQAGTANTAYVPPQTPTYVAAFNDWKSLNENKQFYLIGSGSTYKLGSVSGSQALPTGAKPIDLNVAYAIESKEMALTDWVLARVADENRRALQLYGVNQALNSTPEADVSFDLSSMSQGDLQQLLLRLLKVSEEMQAAVNQGGGGDRRLLAAALGLTAAQLVMAVEQKALFQGQAATLQVGAGETLSQADDFNEVVNSAYTKLVSSLSTQQGTLAGQLDSLTSATKARTGEVLEVDNRLLALTGGFMAALQERLAAAADLALLATSAQAMFGNVLRVQQTSDGNVLITASAASREEQKAAVKEVLQNMTKDPTLQGALVEAMKASAESLGLDTLSDVEQADLFEAAAASIVQTTMDDDSFLDAIAADAVDFGQALSTWLKDESMSAASRDSAQSQSFA